MSEHREQPNLGSRPQNAHLTPWKRGQSGNPKGRPPGIVARDEARKYTDLAIATLVKALQYRQTMVPAAVALLDRGWGKPKEFVETSNLHMLLGGTDSPPIPETIEQWLQRRRAQLDAQLNAKTIEHEQPKEPEPGQ